MRSHPTPGLDLGLERSFSSNHRTFGQVDDEILPRTGCNSPVCEQTNSLSLNSRQGSFAVGHGSLRNCQPGLRSSCGGLSLNKTSVATSENHLREPCITHSLR